MSEKRNIFYLLLLALVAFSSNIWVRSADIMEARNFITAREMLESKNYIITTLNGQLRFEKPPLPTWLTALVMKITGNIKNEVLLRIPVILISVLLIYFIYKVVLEFKKSHRVALLSAFVGTTMFMLIKIGNENSWDMYTYVFSFGAIFFLVKGLKSKKMGYFIGCSIFLSCSILSKGPVGIYGLFIPFLIAHIYVYGKTKYLENRKNLLYMLIITLILSGIWPLLAYRSYPEYFLSVLKKESGTWRSKHTQGIFYYLDYFIYTGSWIFFSILGVNKKILERYSKEKRYSKFLFIWNILIFVFLSLIKMKKKRYGIPLYILSSMEIGVICDYYYDKFWYELNSFDKIFLKIQKYFISFISIGIVGILFEFGYLNGKLSLKYILICTLILGVFNYKILKNQEKVKYVIIGTGVFMLLVNITASWFIDRNFYNKSFVNKYDKLSVLREETPSLEIYSEDYEIEDVWRVGKRINNLDKNIELPEEFILLGKLEKNLSKDYKIELEKTYVKDKDELVKLYYLKKKESKI